MLVLLLSVALSAPPAGATSHLLSNSPVVAKLGLVVRLAHSGGRSVDVLGSSAADLRRVLRVARTKGSTAVFLPFGGTPAVPFRPTSLRFGHGMPMRGTGDPSCGTVPALTARAAAPRTWGVVILGRLSESSLRWYPATPIQRASDDSFESRDSARIPGFEEPCISVRDRGKAVPLSIWTAADVAPGQCAIEPTGPADSQAVWWSQDDDTGVVDLHGVLELGAGAARERWLLVESMYVEAGGPVALDLDGKRLPSATHVVCGDVMAWVGNGDDDE